MSFETELEVAINAAKAAAEILMSYRGKADVTQKATQNLVTEADLRAETAILDIIAQSFPTHQVLGEEGGEIGGNDANSQWVVDPLDGTNNYAHGIPQYCVSIAYYFKNEAQVGVILDPTRDELFHAIRGAGSFLNEKEISTSGAETLQHSIVATGFHYDRGEWVTNTLASIQRLFDTNVRGIRRLGSAALDLAWVACGRLDGYFEYNLSPWDYAAGTLLVEEAGGHTRDRFGETMQLHSGGAIATNGKITDDLLDLIRWTQE